MTNDRRGNLIGQARLDRRIAPFSQYGRPHLITISKELIAGGGTYCAMPPVFCMC